MVAKKIQPACQLDRDACRGRQRRLLQVMAEHDVELFLSNQTQHVQWLSGYRAPGTMHTACALHADGALTVIVPHSQPAEIAADDVRVFTAKWHSTLRNDQPAAAATMLWDAVSPPKGRARVGVEASTAGPHLLRGCESASCVDLEPELYRLRRRKDADELALLRRAIDGTRQMYRAAREMIRPGVNELDVFNRLQAAAVVEFGEMLTGTGNDYQCGARGGPPRDRSALAGELYILDLGPAYRGYFADNARTIAVDGVSDEQHVAWEYVCRALDYVQQTVRPGLSCKQLFQEVQDLLDACPYGVFNHHLGHGIGLFPHEGPHLNPHWDDTFEVGDVFTAEPGLYDPQLLRAGIRIENDFLVTETGVELLTDFPLGL